MSVLKEKEIPFIGSDIETIDHAVYDWVVALNLRTNTNDGFKEVPIHWFTEERAHEVKESRDRRETKTGTIHLPVIAIERTSLEKDPTFKGTAFGNVPHTSDFKGGASAITIARRINQDKTSNFQNARTKKKRNQINFPMKTNEKVVYETMSIPMPVYVKVMYTINVKTQYQQQMNEILQPFITRPGGINYLLLKKDNHRYEAFIEQDFAQNNTPFEQGEEIRYESSITLRVLGYLIGDGKNQIQPKVVVRENAVEFRMPREHIVMGDEPEHTSIQSYVGTEKLGDK